MFSLLKCFVDNNNISDYYIIAYHSGYNEYDPDHDNFCFELHVIISYTMAAHDCLHRCNIYISK